MGKNKKKRKREKGGSKGRRTSRMLGRMGRTQEGLGSVGDTSLIRVKTHKYCSGQVTLGSGDKKVMTLHTTGTPRVDNLKID